MVRRTVGANYGIQGWLQQRITAVIMLISTILVFAFLILAAKTINPNMISWQQFFSYTFVKIIAQITFTALVLHAWIGIRDIWMDYVQSHGLRIVLHVATILWLLGCLIYSIKIVWA